MTRTKRPLTWFILPLSALFVATACGGDKDNSAAATSSATESPGTASASQDLSNVKVPDACTFIPRAELESAIGWQLREGDAKDASPGSYQCDFETPPKMYVERKFANPALPESVNFSSVTVHTHPVDPKNFAEFRKTLANNAEDVPGIGDGAYFYGPNLIYVRVGNRGFSIRLYADPSSDADRAKARELMLSLAKLGVSKLG